MICIEVRIFKNTYIVSGGSGPSCKEGKSGCAGMSKFIGSHVVCMLYVAAPGIKFILSYLKLLFIAVESRLLLIQSNNHAFVRV